MGLLALANYDDILDQYIAAKGPPALCGETKARHTCRMLESVKSLGDPGLRSMCLADLSSTTARPLGITPANMTVSEPSSSCFSTTAE